MKRLFPGAKFTGCKPFYTERNMEFMAFYDIFIYAIWMILYRNMLWIIKLHCVLWACAFGVSGVPCC